jgi:hypothetical protein
MSREPRSAPLPFALKQRWAGIRLKAERFDLGGKRPEWSDADIKTIRMMDAYLYGRAEEKAA